MPIKSFNLMSARRQSDRRFRRRVQWWARAVGAYAVAIAGAGGAVRASAVGSDPGRVADTTELQESIAHARSEIARFQSEISTLGRKQQVVQQISGQPDWSDLLAIVAHAADGRAKLDRLALEPEKNAASATSSRRGRPAPKAAQEQPVRFTLAIDGTSLTQAEVADFSASLQGIGIFEEVRMVETRRQPVGEVDAVRFRMECTITPRRRAKGGA